jgi:hypothetical protein
MEIRFMVHSFKVNPAKSAFVRARVGIPQARLWEITR